MLFLSKEAISRVRDAEKQAADIRERAEKEAQARIEACEKSCAESASIQTDRAAAELKARLEEVRRKADALIVQSREDALADAAELTETAMQKKQEAVKVIIWEMFESCQ